MARLRIREVDSRSYLTCQRDSDHLKRSGGTAKYADASQMFVTRANGVVLPRAKTLRFEAIAVRPSDAMVVPPNSMKVSRVRNFLFRSEVLSGFGLAAAPVNVLK